MRQSWELPERYDFAGTVGQLPLGRFDPCARFEGGSFWFAAHTPDGPGHVRIWREADVLHAAGTPWLVERGDAIAGLRDDLTGFTELAAAHPLVARLAREHGGLRLPATGLVFPRLLRAICEQKITGQEAFRSYAGIVRRWGARVEHDGPELWIAPDAATVAGLAYFQLHPVGLEQRRADTLRRAAAGRTVFRDLAEARLRLRAIPGVGVWTVAEVTRDVYGDPDAVSVGDYHLKNHVAYALAGEARATDERMLELLEPFAGHRGRVCALLGRSGLSAPRYGPRVTLPTHI
ncbi:3-methyladenine DNA glycosylase/8-oxoguanine DNA glycosylase [Allocatelliglobosispora scoriae]|uniref:3-methyladenine DNA glycosylase/8-oxoguanine DNA glycosylase n=1 Tax=Allocatelliglobosispora scoriae TaxID=643052 RepID=A0A841C098_9ACTN|nr:DNA-3-methyladenine glycosylase 2 family protein [Allocatelliglobosispora scoriae]MBB5872472.1 3-methyladenine DNA glycosylase/8-oxoguanine DNA glycosylase [Allocatelliglobosispora scoriae]